MTLIPATHIPLHDGAPVRLVADIVGDHPEIPVALVALWHPLTPEQIREATANMRERVEAMGTLMGEEVPEELTALLEALENQDEHRAVVGEPFEICLN